ncbi:nuclear transport factor 2 family protein [Streptomyces sp. NPDC005402]|uniref:nuclear transport factor 2 family protein n=1 Tax=Streptomyces sp. NPDC005402 TaxID=3155338 RepID=UPI0033A812D4
MHTTFNTPRKAARLLIATATVGALLAGGASAASAIPPRPATAIQAYGAIHQTAANKALVLHYFGQLVNRGNLGAIDPFVEPGYIEHDPTRATGPKALRAWASGLKTAHPQSRATVKKVIAQGDLVVLYSNLILEPGSKGTALVDIFRIAKGRIAEHWDVQQQVPDSTASGHDMFSTLSTPRLPGPDPRASSAYSEKVALGMMIGLAVDHDLTALDRYAAADYIQHSPTALDGTASAKETFGKIFAQFPGFTASPKRVITEGDYVAIHSHYKTSAKNPGTSIVDLLRVRNGKVVEHWDVVQPIPATSANSNTMF